MRLVARGTSRLFVIRIIAALARKGAQAEEPMAVPLRAGDAECHGGQARVGCAVPRESVINDGHPLEPALPLSDQQSPRLQD